MSLSSRLCEKCQQPFEGAKPIFESWSNRSASYKHHQTWEDIKTAAQDGCYFCAWYIKENPELMESAKVDLEIELSAWPKNVTVNAEFVMQVENKSGRDRFYMSVRPTSAMAQYVGNWNPPSRFTADDLRSLITPWLTQCKRHHQKCTSLSRSYTPTRLLRIRLEGSSTYVQLVKCEDLSAARYCTVSHCWGDESLPKLLECNFLELQQGMAVATLPKSYREAIWTSQSLGIEYIWIDSLCIVQDSVEDWRHEAGTMCQVYQGAELNMALTAASNGQKSCLNGRDASLVRSISVRATWVDEAETEFTILPPDDCWREELWQCKLVRRSWVLQEIQLAPRLIIIGRDQIWQTCLEDVFCETFRGGKDKKEVSHHSFAQRRPCGHRAWEEMVEEYMQCGLTVPSDKAIAIGGLAQQYARQLKDEYFAGMWLSQLPGQLLWVPDNGKRVSAYRAPTWSWLSMEGRVHFPRRIFKTTTLCDIHKIGLEFEDPTNPWGGITDGFVVLYGHLITALRWNERKLTFFDHKARRKTTIEHQPGPQASNSDQNIWFVCSADDLYSPWIQQTYGRSPAHLEVQDIDEHYAVDPPQINMLPIRYYCKYDYYCGLILQPVENSDSFKRIGTFSVSTRVARNCLLNTDCREVRII